MEKISTTISIDADIKEREQELFSDFGLDLSTAVNIFLRQSVRENCIPFNIQREIPNADTIAAMKEIEEMERHPEQYKSYFSFAELLKDIEAEDNADV